MELMANLILNDKYLQYSKISFLCHKFEEASFSLEYTEARIQKFWNAQIKASLDPWKSPFPCSSSKPLDSMLSVFSLIKKFFLAFSKSSAVFTKTFSTVGSHPLSALGGREFWRELRDKLDFFVSRRGGGLLNELGVSTRSHG